MLKGALHIHSTYSDGDFTLAELREVLVADGCRFACITDHADWFDEASITAYREECERRSDEQFRFVPGLEYSCAGRMHVLGYGVTELIASADPQEVIAEIRRHQGVAVIAHPRNEAFAAIEQFSELPDGIEVWNSKYDGQYAPRAGTFALLERLRRRRGEMGAFYGLDLHWRNQFRGLLVEIDAAEAGREAVMRALRTGGYVATKADWRLPSDGVVAPEVLARFDTANARSQQMRMLMRRVKGWMDRTGFVVPASIKAQLRRIF